MSTPDLNALLSSKRLPPGPRNPRDPDVAAERHAENVRRLATARGRAFLALSRLHPKDFAALQEQAVAQVNAERGPLPGDPPTNGDAA